MVVDVEDRQPAEPLEPAPAQLRALDGDLLGIRAGRQITVAFWIALVVSGVLGWVFSEIIAMQVRRLSDGALAIAKGNFDLRLKGMFPDEVGELAMSFNLRIFRSSENGMLKYLLTAAVGAAAFVLYWIAAMFITSLVK